MCVCLMFACQPLKAATITYADKVTFMSASGSLDTEDFNALADGAAFHTTPLDAGPFTLSMTGPASTSPGRNEIDAPEPLFPQFDVDGTTIASVLTENGVSLFLTFDVPITTYYVALVGKWKHSVFGHSHGEEVFLSSQYDHSSSGFGCAFFLKMN